MISVSIAVGTCEPWSYDTVGRFGERAENEATPSRQPACKPNQG